MSRTLHEVIVNFDPESPDSYDFHSASLESLEMHIQEVKGQELKNSLLTRTRACAIGLAHDAGRSSEVLRLSASLFQVAASSDPDFVTAVLFRIHALHEQGRHQEEISEAIASVQGGTITGDSLLLMLERIVRDHPGVLSHHESILRRLEKFLDEQSSPIEGVKRPVEAGNLERSILVLAEMIRKRNRMLAEQYRHMGESDL